MTDIAELQELLDGASQRSMDLLLRKQTQPGDEMPKPPKEDLAKSDYCQWEVFPNGVYFATGGTCRTLAVGAYVVQLSPQGIFFERREVMTDTLVDLDDSNSLRVIEGIKLFWTKREHYEAKGLLYKRGIMLWGPAGSGKTATIALLCDELIRQGGIVLLVQNPELAVQGLSQLRKIEPERPLIVILEDIEEIIQRYGEHQLLSLLDGEHQTDNVVNIASTNYPEHLGARIINRPSRFDEVIKIGFPSATMREQYLRHVLKDDADNYALDTWVADTEGLSIAHLKELAIAVTCLDQSYETVIERLTSMKIQLKSNGYEGKVGFTTGGMAPRMQAPIPAATRA